MKINPILNEINSDSFLLDYLTACGVEDSKKYLEADLSCAQSPWLYPNMKEAVDRLHQASKRNDKIGILIDCDYDGISSAACLYNFLMSVCPKLDIKTFMHVGKGHGLVQNSEEDIVQQVIDSGVTLLFAPDSTSNDKDGCMQLKSQGVDIIVLDHHEIIEENPYAIIVNHHLDKTGGLNTDLSGCGVTFKFIQAYAEDNAIDIGDLYYDLVATSIVTDVCSMLHPENKALVEYGFNHITNPMVATMFEKFNRRGNNPIGVAWGIGPAVNAVIRSSDQDAKWALFNGFINSENIDDGISAARKAHNAQTKIVKELYEKIEPTLDNSHKVLVGYSDDENKSFSGLIANKILGNFGKPCLILREMNTTTLTGSLRSPVDIADKINASSLAKCQGHASACGIFVKKSNLNKLLDWFDKQDLSQKPVKTVTAEINPSNINIPLCKACQDNMMLWSGSDGGKIPQPKFYVKLDITPDDVTVFTKKTNTVKVVKDGVSFIKFSVPQSIVDDLKNGDNILEMIVSLEVNEWNGNFTPQANIEEWEITPKEKKEEFIDNSEFDWDEVFK